MLELLVNVDREDIPNDLILLELSVPGSLSVVSNARLPKDWNAVPIPESTRLFGTKWLHAEKTLALAVPSVVIPTRIEKNVLLNPNHGKIKEVKILSETPCPLDGRFLGVSSSN
jgi:RES domain-containing protein